MQFTRQTLHSTCKRFEKALKERNLKLSLSSTQNLWAQIVLGKNYSAASANLNHCDYAEAINISIESIRAQLKAYSREVDYPTARNLFLAAITDDLVDLSRFLHELATVIRAIDGACVMSVLGDSSGLGIFQTGKAGYLPVSTLSWDAKVNFAWCRANSQVSSDLVNHAAGIDPKREMEIFASSHRASDKKSDRAFFEFFSARIQLCAQSISEAILEACDLDDDPDWNIDVDDVRDVIFSVFEKLSRGVEWVKPDSDFAEALIDHLAVRVRESLKWLCGLDEGESEEHPPKETLHRSVALSMTKFLEGAAFKSG